MLGRHTKEGAQSAQSSAHALGLVGLLLLAGLAGCSEVAEESSLRSTGQAALLAPSLPVFAQAVDANAVLGATEWLEIGDRVRVLDAGRPAGVTNAGTGVTRVGSDAQVGSIFAGGAVDLRDRATVEGSVFAGSVARGNQVRITGGILAAPSGTQELYESAPSYAVSGGDVRLEPDRTRSLPPGRYGVLELKERATVTLDAGEYFFTRVMMNSGSRLLVTSVCDRANIRVRDALTFRGRIESSGANQLGVPVAFVFEGTETAHIEAPLRAMLMAPRAEVIVNSAQHEAALFAKRLRIQAGATIVAPAVAPDSIPSCRVEPAVEVPDVGEMPDIGPAPTLLSAADAGPFLDWLYRTRKRELPEARAALRGVGESPAILNAFVARFEAERQARRIGGALMVLLAIGALEGQAPEDFLLGLLAAPLPPEPSEEEGRSFQRFDDEVAYRNRVMDILSSRRSLSGLAAIRGVAVNHAEEALREHAIVVLVRGKDADFKEALRLELRATDRHLVDLPHQADPDFIQALITYGQQYSGE